MVSLVVFIVYLLNTRFKSYAYDVNKNPPNAFTKSLEAMVHEYEDDKNSMISMTEKEDAALYYEFYDELDNRITSENSMNMIFFGPPSSFMRLDAETILHILSNTKKHLIPISRALLAWDIITDGKTAAFLQGREFASFEVLLNVIPEEDLYYTNFGDPSVLRYFSKNNIKLHKRKIGVLVAAYRRYFGYNWYANSTRLNDLGYLLCGFPPTELKLIPPSMFKELNTDVLTRLDMCDPKQMKTLYNIATQPDAFGSPYKWTSHEVVKLGSLFTCVPQTRISAIQLEAIPALTPKVMKSINQEKLEYFTKQQILRMNSKARRIFILRLQLRNSLDMSQLTSGYEFNFDPHPILVNVVTLVLFYYNV